MVSGRAGLTTADRVLALGWPFSIKNTCASLRSCVGRAPQGEGYEMNDNTVSLEEFWSLVKALNGDVERCMTALHETPEDDAAGKQFWRRMYARAVFAMIDGATYRMMFHAYAARDRRDVTFSLDELMKLESYYDFDEDQEAVTTFSKTQMLDSIRFAFNAFARVHYSDYILPIHDQSWILVKEMAYLRECWQYPREVQGIEVYEENIDTLVAGLLWLVERLLELLKSCQLHALEKFAAWEAEEDEPIM